MLADSDQQPRRWIERKDPDFDPAEDVVNDLYDRFLEGGVDDLLGCELCTEREMLLLRSLQVALDGVLDGLDVREGAGDSWSRENAQALLNSPGWPDVCASAQALRRELIGNNERS